MANLHISFITLILSLTTTTTAQPPLESFIYGGCSPITYTPNSAFASSLNSLLTALTTSSSTSPYSKLTQNDVVSGLYQCRGDLPTCPSCVSHAISKLTATCPSSSGAAVQLTGCYVKYDAAPFLGVQDKSLLFKKCGPVGLKAQDEVLDGLVDGPRGEMYWAVRAGGARGMAQCVGDLSVDQCGDCVDQAVRVARSECGEADYGDVFLGKCYVRFSVFGSVVSNGTGYVKNFGSVKTFAIIAGLLAAIVILVLFFTFLCRAFGGGKHTGGK